MFDKLKRDLDRAMEPYKEESLDEHQAYQAKRDVESILRKHQMENFLLCEMEQDSYGSYTIIVYSKMESLN